MDRFELAWAAGFFDGEGWTNAVGQSGRRTRQPQARINQADPNGMPEVLVRFKRAVGGLGRLGGPYEKDGRKDLYHWEISSRGDVELLHHLLLPWLGQVKLDEFALALDRRPARSRAATPSADWRAWAAGLFDGEGSLYLLKHRSHEGYRTAEMCVTQSGFEKPEVLVRFASLVRVGHLNGPYDQVGGNLPVWRFKTAAWRDIETILGGVWPWLSEVKRAQSQRAIDAIHGQEPLPRGNPAWGNRKTHCINGHDYATARLRPYRPRGRASPPRRDNHQCLACAREQARKRREQKRTSAADDECRSTSNVAARYLLK